MGLTNSSIGRNAVDCGLVIKKQSPADKVIALAGNPNVGKSTVFNSLTGMNQHTGNWPGKTVTNAQGYLSTGNHSYVLVDIPGTYSLMAHSTEEEAARNFICFGNPDAVVVVCDATCLERNLNLVLQTMEICQNVIVCVNLMDEAKRKKIEINLPLLSKLLGVPVVGTAARNKKGLEALTAALDQMTDNLDSGQSNSEQCGSEQCDLEQSGSEQPEIIHPYQVIYPESIEKAVSRLMPYILPKCNNTKLSRWLSFKLLEQDETLIREAMAYLGVDFLAEEALCAALAAVQDQLAKDDINPDNVKDLIVSALVNSAEKISREVVTCHEKTYNNFDLKLDKILTSRCTGYPVMLLLLAVIFWLTITGANYPSKLMAGGLFWLQDRLTDFFVYLKAPSWLHGVLVLGVYRVLAWVVSVMLPPMAIFFPLFTLLEDAGYLPRIAYNLDKPFKCCCACGKQALTMCMGCVYLQAISVGFLCFLR